MATVRHRPEALELLEAQSKFTKKELQILYRGFKNVSGTIFVNFFISLSTQVMRRKLVDKSVKQVLKWKMGFSGKILNMPMGCRGKENHCLLI